MRVRVVALVRSEIEGHKELGGGELCLGDAVAAVDPELARVLEEMQYSRA